MLYFRSGCSSLVCFANLDSVTTNNLFIKCFEHLICYTSQLSELLNVEFYGEWLGLVAEFTTKSLLSWQVCLLAHLIFVDCCVL